MFKVARPSRGTHAVAAMKVKSLALSLLVILESVMWTSRVYSSIDLARHINEPLSARPFFPRRYDAIAITSTLVIVGR